MPQVIEHPLLVNFRFHGYHKWIHASNPAQILKIAIIPAVKRTPYVRVYAQRAVTVFSSKKSLMDAMRDFAPPIKEVLLEPRGKKAYG